MLEIESLTKSFTVHRGEDDALSVTPFHDLSFAVAPGEFLGIAGPSGIGKSSILKCIYRAYLPTSGRIRYRSAAYGEIDLAVAADRTIARLRRREIGYVSQFLRVIPRVPAIEIVAGELAGAGPGKDEALRQARGILERLGIPQPLWAAYPATFSGGEQQRINLARAIAVQPRLLILDEPTASLDGGTKASVLALLRELKEAGTTMIGVFHDADMMEQAADRILDLRHPLDHSRR